MKIEIRHIDRTVLNVNAYIKLIRKYAKLKNKILIIFDKRIKDYGQYNFDSNKRTHVIKISPILNKTIKQNSIIENTYKVETVDPQRRKISANKHNIT